ncbi:kelch repeat-containing protein [Pseudomonas sp. PS01300]|uniref:Kelch repeat-containing protein n=1 Tax=Pseudomonas sp. PS01300 TaxID=2991436 RepID=UPI00249AC04B|nr:kelch repeat-containing protein [Pseudomonas sp. PS01300]
MDIKRLATTLALSAVAYAANAEMHFQPVGDMVVPASQHRDVLLKNGNVLITGGQNGEGGIANAQVFDPKTKKFTDAGMMTEPRFVHAMNVLSDGRVLITAGFSKAGQFLQTSELYDGKSFRKGPQLVENRDNQRTIDLGSGKVFIEGGDNEKLGYIASTELFDPKGNTFTAGPLLPTGRAMDTISDIGKGKTLLAGGMKIVDFKQVFLKETVIYEEKSNTVKAGPDLITARKQHKATTLRDGRVLFTGGMNDSGTLDSAEIYSSGKIKQAAKMVSPRREHCSVLLNDGRVLVAGGHTGIDFTATTEVFDPSTGKFSAGPSMAAARAFPTCTKFKDGTVLVAGGSNQSGATKSAEILVP